MIFLNVKPAKKRQAGVKPAKKQQAGVKEIQALRKEIGESTGRQSPGKNLKSSGIFDKTPAIISDCGSSTFPR